MPFHGHYALTDINCSPRIRSPINIAVETDPRARHIELSMPFAQLVIGAPGSGKSTYCDGMQQFLSAIGRKCSIVNLDPANDRTSYECALDIRDLVTLEEIMEEDNLGPNGAILYALEELEHNWEWLERGLRSLGGI